MALYVIPIQDVLGLRAGVEYCAISEGVDFVQVIDDDNVIYSVSLHDSRFVVIGDEEDTDDLLAQFDVEVIRAAYGEDD